MDREDEYAKELKRLIVESGPIRVFTDEENQKMAEDMFIDPKEKGIAKHCNQQNRLI